MPRMSGFEVVIRAFVPCSPSERGSIGKAETRIIEQTDALRTAGFLDIRWTQVYRQRADVADVLPKPAPAEPAARPFVNPSNADPEQPAELRRKPA